MCGPGIAPYSYHTGVCRKMGSASKSSPGKRSGFGSAERALGAAAVSEDKNKDKDVKSDVIASQDSRPKAGGRRAPAVLDRWFDAQLGRLYSDVAAEPVPVEMLQLISKLKKPKQSGS